jgi:hypothetical protein
VSRFTTLVGRCLEFLIVVVVIWVLRFRQLALHQRLIGALGLHERESLLQVKLIQYYSVECVSVRDPETPEHSSHSCMDIYVSAYLTSVHSPPPFRSTQPSILWSN